MTKQEYAVFAGIVSGGTTGQVAKRLKISPGHVSNTLRRVSAKFPGLGPAISAIRTAHKQHQAA